jgi:hypothetical protein
MCPASSFCLGGVTQRQSCPVGTFAPEGSTKVESCKPAAFLALSVELPFSPVEFSVERRSAFRDAIAYTCGVAKESVVVDSAAAGINSSMTASSSASRRAAILASALVATKDVSVAVALKDSLREDTLNSRLKEQGLPQGRLVSVAIASTNESLHDPSLWSAVGGALAGFAVLIAALATAAWYLLRHKATEEELLLQCAITSLRVRFGIELRNGFTLNTEQTETAGAALWRVCWRGNRCDAERIVIQRTYMEAAARLELRDDFDVHHFDAFCLCLECASDAEARHFNVPLKATENRATPYEKLCSWILEAIPYNPIYTVTPAPYLLSPAISHY